MSLHLHCVLLSLFSAEGRQWHTECSERVLLLHLPPCWPWSGAVWGNAGVWCSQCHSSAAGSQLSQRGAAREVRAVQSSSAASSILQPCERLPGSVWPSAKVPVEGALGLTRPFGSCRWTGCCVVTWATELCSWLGFLATNGKLSL